MANHPNRSTANNKIGAQSNGLFSVMTADYQDIARDAYNAIRDNVKPIASEFIELVGASGAAMEKTKHSR